MELYHSNYGDTVTLAMAPSDPATTLPNEIFETGMKRRLLIELTPVAPSERRKCPVCHKESTCERSVQEPARSVDEFGDGTDILNPEGDFPEQPDPTFTRDRFLLKHSHGGGGFSSTAERIPFLNSLFYALPAISDSTAQALLWPSLVHVAGGRSVYDKDSKSEAQCWTTFFASGCRTAREMQEEITRIQRLRDEALELAGLAANPPQSAVFDRPDEGTG